MKGDRIPDDDHVARHCGGATINEDGTVSGTAFRLRAGKDDHLSVNWLEFLDAHHRSDQLAALREAFHAKKFDLRPKARFSVLNVGEFRQHVQQESNDGRDLQVRHEPVHTAEFDDPSHAGIFGYSPDDDLIAGLIAEVVREVYPARG